MLTGLNNQSLRYINDTILLQELEDRTLLKMGGSTYALKTTPHMQGPKKVYMYVYLLEGLHPGA